MQQQRLARLGQHVRAIVRRRAIHTQAHPRAGALERPQRRDPRCQPHVRAGAVRRAGARAAQPRDLVGRGVNHMRMPDIRPNPAEILGQLDRRAAECGTAVGVLIQRLG